MKPEIENFIKKVSENNNMMVEYAKHFQDEIDKNYISRRRSHLFYTNMLLKFLIFWPLLIPSKGKIRKGTREHWNNAK